MDLCCAALANQQASWLSTREFSSLIKAWLYLGVTTSKAIALGGTPRWAIALFSINFDSSSTLELCRE